MTTDVLGKVAGIEARYLWDRGTTPSSVADQTGLMALEDAGIQAQDLELLINTSVSQSRLARTLHRLYF